MSTFYDELKKLREEQGIDLAEIHSRTKIGIPFLKAIESGQFEILPIPYIRLFLKAYVKEVGGDPDKIIAELENYLDEKNGKSPEHKPEPTLYETEDIPEPILKQSTQTTTRTNLIKGSVLLLIFIFSIIIIRKITMDPTEAYGNRTHVLGQDIITTAQLIEDYTSFSNQTQIIDSDPPFSVKVACNQPIGFQTLVDSLNSESISLITGEQQTFSFDKELYLLFNHTRGVYIYLNGKNLNEIDGHPYPVALTLTVDPPHLSVKQYTPITSVE